MIPLWVARTISEIDRDIDANRVAFQDRVIGVRAVFRSAAWWQAAWDAHPDLWNRDKELFRERGIAQHLRDIKTIDDARLCNRYLKEFSAKYGVKGLSGPSSD